MEPAKSPPVVFLGDRMGQSPVEDHQSVLLGDDELFQI